jgi:hypothetical protein
MIIWATITINFVYFVQKMTSGWLRTKLLTRILPYIFASLLIGCSSEEEQISYLSGNPCEPPCWQEIVPGSTKETDALNLLKELGFLDQNSIEEHGIPYGLGELLPLKENLYLAYDYNFRDGTVGRLHVKNDFVYRIDFQPPAGKLKLTTVTDSWGMPDFVYVTYGSFNQISCYDTLLFFWDKEAFVQTEACAESGEPYDVRNMEALIAPEIRIVRVSFFNSTSDIQSTLEEVFYPDFKLAVSISTHSEPWTGFGFYSIVQGAFHSKTLHGLCRGKRYVCSDNNSTIKFG